MDFAISYVGVHPTLLVSLTVGVHPSCERLPVQIRLGLVGELLQIFMNMLNVLFLSKER